MNTWPWEKPVEVVTVHDTPRGEIAEWMRPKDLDGIPDFLRRVRMPDGTVRIGLESVRP